MCKCKYNEIFVSSDERHLLDDFETMPPLMLAVDLSGKSHKRIFMPFDDENALVQFIKRNPDLSIHEMLLRNTTDSVQRMYFDFDCDEAKLKNTNMTAMELFDLFISNMDGFFKHIAKIDDRYLKYHLLSCHREGKISFHVIFINLLINTQHYECVWENICKAVEIDLLTEGINAPIRKIIDGAVYCSNRSIRVHGSAKRGEIHKIINENSSAGFDRDTLIAHIPEIQREYRCSANPEYCCADKKLKASDEPPTQEQMIKAIAKLEQMSAEGAPFSVRTHNGHKMKDNGVGFVNLNLDRSRDCFVCKRKHDHENGFALVTNKSVVVFCHRNKNKGEQIIDFEIERYEAADVSIERNFNIMRTDYEFIKNIDEANTTTCYLKSMMKTGKSRAFSRYVNEQCNNDPNFTCIIITYRTNLAGEICANNPKFEKYTDIKTADIILSKHKLIIVQFESLHRLVLDCNINLCFIDEACSLLSQTQSGLCRNSYVFNIMKMQQILNINTGAAKSIIADALMDKNVVNAFECFRRDPSAKVWINNTPKIWGIHIKPIADPSDWRCALIAAINNGENIYVTVTHGEEWILSLEALIKKNCPGKTVLSIYGGGDDNQTIMSDVNAELTKYNIVIASPCMSAGISYDVKDHFSRIFAYVDNSGPSFIDVVQSLYRVRCPKNNAATIYINTAKMNAPTKITDVMMFEQSKLYYNSADYISKGIQLEYNNNNVNAKGMKFANEHDPRLMFELYAKAAVNKWGLDIKNDLWDFLRSQGAIFEDEIQLISGISKERTNERREFKELKRGVRYDKSVLVAKTNMISEAEYDEISKLKRLTAEKKAMIEKYNISRAFSYSDKHNNIIDLGGEFKKCLKCNKNVNDLIDIAECVLCEYERISGKIRPYESLADYYNGNNLNDPAWIQYYNKPKVFDMFYHARDRYATDSEMIAEDDTAKMSKSDVELINHPFKSAKHKVINDIRVIVKNAVNVKEKLLEYLSGLQKKRHPLVAKRTKIVNNNVIAAANDIMSVYGWKIKNERKKDKADRDARHYYIKDVLADYFVINLRCGGYLNPLSIEAEFFKPIVNMRY